MKSEGNGHTFSHCHQEGDTQVQIKVTHTFFKTNRRNQRFAGPQNMPREMEHAPYLQLDVPDNIHIETVSRNSICHTVCVLEMVMKRWWFAQE